MRATLESSSNRGSFEGISSFQEFWNFENWKWEIENIFYIVCKLNFLGDTYYFSSTCGILEQPTNNFSQAPGQSQNSYSKERTWVDTLIKQATTPPHQTTKHFKGRNLKFLLSDNSEFEWEGPGLKL